MWYANVNVTIITSTWAIFFIGILPSTLTVRLAETGEGVNIYPNLEGNIENVKYRTSQGSLTRVTPSITVNNNIFNISFYHCLTQLTFPIGKLLFESKMKSAVEMIMYQ